jgi:hypothetical protein
MQFVDKKEEEIKKIMERRSSIKDTRAAGSADSSAKKVLADFKSFR